MDAYWSTQCFRKAKIQNRLTLTLGHIQCYIVTVSFIGPNHTLSIVTIFTCALMLNIYEQLGLTSKASEKATECDYDILIMALNYGFKK